MKNIIRLSAVRTKTFQSCPNVYGLIKRGHFLKPIRHDGRSVGWFEHEVEGWIASSSVTQSRGGKGGAV